MGIPWPRQRTRANQLVILDRLTEISGDNKQLRGGKITHEPRLPQNSERLPSFPWIRPFQPTREITNSILSHWSEDKRLNDGGDDKSRFICSPPVSQL